MTTSLATDLKDVGPACVSLSLLQAGTVVRAVAAGRLDDVDNEDPLAIVSLACRLAVQQGPAPTADAPNALEFWHFFWALCSVSAVALVDAPAKTAAEHIERVISTLYLPFLDAPEGAASAQQRNDVADAAIALVLKCSAWNIAITLLENSTAPLSQALSPSQSNGAIQLTSKLVAVAIEESSVAEKSANGSTIIRNSYTNASPQDVLRYASEVGFPNTLDFLASKGQDSRGPALGQFLLPAQLAAANALGQESLSSCLAILWKTCRDLGTRSNATDRRTGLALLVQFSGPLLTQRNISTDETLWSLLLESLGSDQGLVRKRALHVLEAALAVRDSQGDAHSDTYAGTYGANPAAWATFIKLYATVEDTSLHLFKESWGEMDTLHPPAKMLLDCERFEEGITEPHTSMSNTTNGTEPRDPIASLALPLPWMLLLWRKALKHRHTTAQKLAMLSFLNRAWPENTLSQLPVEFFNDPLLQILGQTSIQRGDYASDIQAALPAFFRSWSAALPLDLRPKLLSTILGALSGRQQQQVMMLCAAGALREVAGAADLAGIWSTDAQNEFLDNLSTAAAVAPGYGANAVALKVYDALAKAQTACVVVDSSRTLLAVGKWLDKVPLPLLQAGETLGSEIAAWLGDHSRHTISLPGALAQLVGDCLKEEGEEALQEEAPTPGQVARLALLIGESIGCDGLDSALCVLREQIPQGPEAIDRCLPFMLALLQVCEPLPGREGDDCGVLPRWVSTVAAELAPVISEHAMHNIDYVVDMAGTERRAELEAACDQAVAAAGSDPTSAFNLDAVLPKHLLKVRNAAYNSLECVASAAQALQRQKREGVVEASMQLYERSCCAYFTACSKTYKELDLDILDPEITRKRVKFEVAVAMLRPLIACCQALSGGSRSISPTAASIQSLLQSVSHGLPQPAPPSLSTDARPTGKKKRSVKLQSLTLDSWHFLLSWRALDALLSVHKRQEEDRMDANSLPPQTAALVLVLALAHLSTASNGNNALLPLIRCVRALLPEVVQLPHVMVPAVAAEVAQLGCSQLSSETLDGVFSYVGKILVGTMMSQTRKRAGLSAAIVSTCLHPCLFSAAAVAVPAPSVRALHQEGGAVRRTVSDLLDVASKVSRLLVLMVTHLAALLAAFPALGPAYADVVVDLSMVAFEDDSLTFHLRDVVLDAPSVTELASIMEPLDPQLAAAHCASPAAPRVGTLCMLGSWAAAAAGGDVAASTATSEIWSRILTLATTDEELISGRYIHRGDIHRRKLRAWQALTVLCPAVAQSSALSTLHTMFEALSCQNAANVKQYQEIIAMQMVMWQPDLLETEVLPLIEDYAYQRVDALPSLMSLATTSLLALRPIKEEASWKALTHRVVTAIIPWTGSFVHPNRTFSQLVTWRLLELCPWLEAQDTSLAAHHTFFRTNVELCRLRGAMGVSSGLDAFDLKRATSARGVLCDELALLGESNNGGPLEGAPSTLLDRILDYLAQERAVLRDGQAIVMTECVRREEEVRTATAMATAASSKVAASAVITPAAEGTQSGDFWQRKITPADKEAAVFDPWGAALGLSNLSSRSQGNVDTFEAGALRCALQDADGQRAGARQDVIVVASLVDRIPNLAGLARTCEVFRANRLVIADASITADPEFSSVSVSAEHWQPIEEVHPLALAPWLQRKAAEGYSLVGLEQTAESTKLPEFVFPKRTVLVLGAEKEGVPAELLALLDATVEIPQLGVVRSLNVHVSAAIGIYEYTRQALLAKKDGFC